MNGYVHERILGRIHDRCVIGSLTGAMLALKRKPPPCLHISDLRSNLLSHPDPTQDRLGSTRVHIDQTWTCASSPRLSLPTRFLKPRPRRDADPVPAHFMPPSSIPIQAHYLSLSASLASCVYLYSPAFLPHSLSLSLPLSLFLTFFHSSRTPTHTLSNTHIHTHKLPLSLTHAHTPRHTHAHDYTHTRTLTNARAHTRTQAHTLLHWRWHLTARHSHPSLPPFPFSAYDVFHPCQWLNFWGFRGAEVRGRTLSAVMQVRLGNLM
jgi:hypothetical protein